MAKTTKKTSKPVAAQKPAAKPAPTKPDERQPKASNPTRKPPPATPSVVPTFQPSVMGIPITPRETPYNHTRPANAISVGGLTLPPGPTAREAVENYKRATHQPYDDVGLLDYRRGEREAPRLKQSRSTAPPVPSFVRAPLGGAYFDIGTRLARGNYNGQPGVVRPPVGGVYATDEAFLPAYQGESGGYSGGGGSGGYDDDGYFPRYGGGGGGGYSPREYEDPAWLAGLMSWRF